MRVNRLIIQSVLPLSLLSCNPKYFSAHISDINI